MKVTFCGHSQISQSTELEAWLFDVTCRLIENGADTFYLGGYGDFDRMAASVLCRQKEFHPSIERVLVLAYLNSGKKDACCDYTIFPPLENVPHRFAISRRNRWMVEACDVVVSYVLHDWGGAAATLRYARQKGRQVISYTAAKDGGLRLDRERPESR